MRKKSPAEQTHTLSVTNFDDLRELLGKPFLAKGETLEQYKELEESLMARLKPHDAQEYIWVKDVVDLQWELLRMRQIKIKYLNARTWQGLKIFLQERDVDTLEAQKLSKLWMENNPRALTLVKKMFTDWAADESDILASTYMRFIENMERIDRMIIGLEARRNAALREIERHREIKRKYIHDIIDIEETGS